jgi:hypothetical protein
MNAPSPVFIVYYSATCFVLGQSPTEHCMHLKVPPCTRCSMSVGHVMWNTSGDSLTGSHGGHQPENREIKTVQ